MKPFENWNPKSLVLAGAALGVSVLLLLAAVPSQTDFDGTYFKTNSLPISLTGFLTNWAKLDTNASGGDTIWTNIQGMDSEGGTIYGATTLNTLTNNPVSFAVNYLTNAWADFGTIISAGYHSLAPLVGGSESTSIISIGDYANDGAQLTGGFGSLVSLGMRAGSSMRVNRGEGMVNIGENSGQNAYSERVFGLFNIGDSSGNSTNTYGASIFNIGSGAQQQSYTEGCSFLYSFGPSAGEAMKYTNCSDVFAIGQESMWFSTMTDSKHVYSIGFHSGEHLNGSYTNIYLWGGNSVPTLTSDQHVFGDASVAEYYFPGRSIKTDGSITSGGNTNRWIFGGVTNGAPDVSVDGTHYPLAVTDSPALTGTPTINGQSVETQLTNKVAKAGDTMTGALYTPLLSSSEGIFGSMSVNRGTLTHSDGMVIVDFAQTNRYWSCTITGNVTFVLTNAAAGKWANLFLFMPATNCLATWNFPVASITNWFGGQTTNLTANTFASLSYYPISTDTNATKAIYVETQ